MKKIIIIVFLVIFFNCEEDTKQYDLKGNWSVVTIDSLYYEIEVESDKMLFYNYDTGFLPYKPYEKSKDSLFIYESENKIESVGYLLELINDDRFNLRNNGLRMSFFRIDSLEFTFDKTQSLNNDKLKFEVSFLNRKNKLFGIDHRYNLDSVTKVFENMKNLKTESINDSLLIGDDSD